MTSAILVIDDSKQARSQVIEILRNNGLFKFYYEAADGIEAIKLALNQPVDLILCDVEMPGMDGFKFLRMLRSREELQDVPVIMLTGREDPEAKVRGLEQGASDYVTKPFDRGELLARVKVQLKIKSLQDKLKKSNQLLRDLSHTDPLTGLDNRRSMMDMLDRELERSQRLDTPLSLVMLDVDFFKKVNDNFGHQQGDEILKALAGQLRQALRQYDMAARFGGEEFALILPGIGLDGAVKVAERLRRQVEATRIETATRPTSITVSLGVACHPGPHIHTVDDLIREADAALYSAKRNGRNRIETVLSRERQSAPTA